MAGKKSPGFWPWLEDYLLENYLFPPTKDIVFIKLFSMARHGTISIS
jgi:hypothetical protein